MPTKSDVINETLLACDQPPMTGPSDTASWVRRVVQRYPAAVRRLLEIHPWNFATTRVQLTALDEDVIGNRTAFNKPGDCMRIILVNSTGRAHDRPEPNYEDEAGRILSSYDPCFLFYVSSNWLIKEGSWPQVFADAVSADLAARCYGLFGKSAAKKDELKKDARRALSTARSWDGQQVPWQELPRGRWARSRTGWPAGHGAWLDGDSGSGSSSDLDGDSGSGNLDGDDWTP